MGCGSRWRYDRRAFRIHRFRGEGYPALVVAEVNFATVVTASSYATVATAGASPLASTIFTLLTPGTLERTRFTMGAHNEQVAFSTVRTAVFSVA